MKKQITPSYENNPFLIGLAGLRLFFRKAQPVAIIAIILAVISAASQRIQNIFDTAERNNQLTSGQVYEKWQGWIGSLSTSDIVIYALVIATVAFLLLLATFILKAMFDYTSAQIASDKAVTIGEAFKAATTHIGSYTWLQIIIAVKIVLWTLLFIIPGIIMAVRYSLSGVSFFETDKRGTEAIKHSLQLTKGAWLTTFSSRTLWNIMTLGFIEPVLAPGTNAVLYRQYKQSEATNEPKPQAHVLSWLTLVVPIVLFCLLLLGVVLFALLLNTNGFS